jgi:hypothetical protein
LVARAAEKAFCPTWEPRSLSSISRSPRSDDRAWASCSSGRVVSAKREQRRLHQ